MVGSAIKDTLDKYWVPVTVYDKYKELGRSEDLAKCYLIFLCLPTPYDRSLKSYNKTELENVVRGLADLKFKGPVILKSTVEPGTTESLAKLSGLKLCHNPEFLTAKSAAMDFRNQRRVILGSTSGNGDAVKEVSSFYKAYFPHAEIVTAESSETEAMKLFCNSFYAVKVQFFTELFLLCKDASLDFEKIRSLMAREPWVGDMHTHQPGPDGMISYGGYCFPKDTRALLALMRKVGARSRVLQAAMEEREELRIDNPNVI